MATSTDDRRMVSAWIEPTLAERLDEAAREADRSRSAEIRTALREHLERTADDETGDK
jgi:metal-responsive CopG/Arc/MetJ family transcriptional regulator